MARMITSLLTGIPPRAAIQVFFRAFLVRISDMVSPGSPSLCGDTALTRTDEREKVLYLRNTRDLSLGPFDGL
jgi:hypothetical protein